MATKKLPHRGACFLCNSWNVERNRAGAGQGAGGNWRCCSQVWSWWLVCLALVLVRVCQCDRCTHPKLTPIVPSVSLRTFRLMRMRGWPAFGPVPRPKRKVQSEALAIRKAPFGKEMANLKVAPATFTQPQWFGVVSIRILQKVKKIPSENGLHPPINQG